MTAPLSGIRVLDLGRFIAAPWAGQLLADLGAEVIKVEQPGTGDPMRQSGPTFVTGPDGEPTDLSAYLVAANRNKRSLTLDVTTEKGRELLLRLAAQSDVVIENFRAGYLDRHRIGFDALHAANARLILCSISGFGQSGPLATLPATDSLAQAMSGLMSVTGEADRPPQKIGVTIIDVLTGVYAATAIMAALREVENGGGEGQHIDLSLFDAAMAAMSHAAQDYLITGNVPMRNGGVPEGAAPGKVFATADGWLNIQGQYDKAFPRLCDVLGLPDLVADPDYANSSLRWAHRDRLMPVVEGRIKTMATADLLARLTEAGVMAAPVLTVEQAFALPHSVEREIRREAVREDGLSVPLVASPLRLKGARERYDVPPRLGQHNEEILSELLDLSAEELGQLRDEGVI